MNRKAIFDVCAPEKGPLLIRYQLLRTPWFNIYLHHFLRSDNDRHFHDHPWHFLTILLAGGYIEHTPCGTFRRRRFSVLVRPAWWQHWVEIQPRFGHCSLLVPGNASGDSGFPRAGWTSRRITGEGANDSQGWRGLWDDHI
jgi:hypothetical protein